MKKVSCVISDVLLEDFNYVNGFELIHKTLEFFETKKVTTQVMVRIPSSSPSHSPFPSLTCFPILSSVCVCVCVCVYVCGWIFKMKKGELLEVLFKFVYVGKEDIKLSNSVTPYNHNLHQQIMSNQKLEGTASDESFQNLKAKNQNVFRAVQQYFLKSKNDEYRIKILDNFLSVYSSNFLNFLLLQPLNTFSHFIDAFDRFSNELRVRTLLPSFPFVSSFLFPSPLSSFSFILDLISYPIQFPPLSSLYPSSPLLSSPLLS